MSFPIKAYVKHVTPGAGPLLALEASLNKLGRGSLGDATYQISSLSDKKIFHVFPYKAYVIHVTPGRGHFWPQGYNLNKLGRGPLGDATYQISRV